MSEAPATYKRAFQLLAFCESYAIGIDPGTKTGLAIWNKTRKTFEAIETMKIHEALAVVESFCLYAEAANSQVIIYIENPNTWRGWGSRTEGTAKAQGAGSIKRDYAIWKDFCEAIRVEMIPVKLQGTLKKLPADKFKQLTGFGGKTTEHGRDAACMVFNR